MKNHHSNGRRKGLQLISPPQAIKNAEALLVAEDAMQIKRSVLLALSLFSIAPGGVSAQATSEVRAIVNRAIRASGGESRLTRLKAATWTLNGKYFENKPPSEFTGEWSRESPDRVRAILRGQINNRRFEFVTVLNG